MDNAFEVIKVLSKKYKIVIVSMGNYSNIALKQLWIDNNIKEYVSEFIGLDFDLHSEKSSINMIGNIFVDDNAEYLYSSNASRKICFGDVFSWNADWKNERCFNWYEVLNRLM